MAGHIEKRGDNVWRVTVFLGTDPTTGETERHRKTIHGTKKDAQRYLTAALRERDLGRFSEPSKLRVNEYLDRWLDDAARPRLAERSLSDYTEILIRYVRPHIGTVPLDRVTPLLLQGMYTDLQKKGLTAATVRKAHAVLHSALKQAVRWRLLTYNPARDLELPRIEKKEMQALDETQAQRFIEAAAQDSRGLAYLVGIASGMRPQEYLGLRWPDLNLSNGAVRIQRVLNWRRKGGGWVLTEPKTARSRRTVILPSSLLPALREHRARQNEDRLRLGTEYQTHGFVFATAVGGPLDSGNLNARHFKKILAAAGLPLTLRPYALRHSCATLLMAAGKNPKVVAERLGHASTMMTLDVYSHVTPTMQQDAADAIDRMLFG